MNTRTNAHQFTNMRGEITRKPLGFVVYEGPSLIDGSPIVVIVNKVFAGSKNEKTGEIVQSFILRQDVDPVSALKTGQDESICGTCKHRPKLVREGNGQAPCYVNVGRSALAVWKAYKAGSYVKADPTTVASFLADKTLRLGTYGDPWAAPVSVWSPMADAAERRVGYSHQWQNPAFDVIAWAPLVMASADTLAERMKANEQGLRTFRVAFGNEWDKVSGEAVCPASAEAGKRTTCADCRLCGGTSVKAKDIVIRDHAIGHASRARKVIAIAVD
jgi:hypothetical protein